MNETGLRTLGDWWPHFALHSACMSVDRVFWIILAYCYALRMDARGVLAHISSCIRSRYFYVGPHINIINKLCRRTIDRQGMCVCEIRPCECHWWHVRMRIRPLIKRSTLHCTDIVMILELMLYYLFGVCTNFKHVLQLRQHTFHLLPSIAQFWPLFGVNRPSTWVRTER